jgi:hypothetical protein
MGSAGCCSSPMNGSTAAPRTPPGRAQRRRPVGRGRRCCPRQRAPPRGVRGHRRARGPPAAHRLLPVCFEVRVPELDRLAKSIAAWRDEVPATT